MAVFSVTDRQNFRRCRRKWDYSSNARQNLTGVGAGPEPLELGSLIHRALADWILHYTEERKEAQKQGYLATLFLQHAAQRQKEIVQSFEEKFKHKIPNDKLDSLHNVVELGTHMMVNYEMYHQSPIPNHMSFASPEQEVLVPVPGTEHNCSKCLSWANEQGFVTVTHTFNPVTEKNDGTVKFVARRDCLDCNGSGQLHHYLSATLDGLLQDDKGRLFVLEHKTYENRPRLIDLQMNDQFTGYCWVVQQLGMGRVGGVAYDGMWKRQAPPKYMQKEKRAGTLEDLFIRKVLFKSELELNEWGRNLAFEINEMANNPEIYPNVPWQGCTDCNFLEPCLMQMHGEDPTNLIKLRYTQREVVRGGRETA